VTWGSCPTTGTARWSSKHWIDFVTAAATCETYRDAAAAEEGGAAQKAAEGKLNKHGANVPSLVHFVPGAVDGFISPVISDILRGLAKKRADRDNADDSAMGSWYNFFMEAFAITAARNFARVLLIRAENTMKHLGMLGARQPVSLVDAESLRMCGSFPTRPTRRRSPEPASALGHAMVLFSLYSANRAPPDRR